MMGCMTLPGGMPEYCEIMEYTLRDGTSGGFSVCEPGKGIGGSVADNFSSPAEAAQWAVANGYTVLNPTQN